MFTLLFTEQFENAFSKLRDNELKKQIWNKVRELEQLAPLGKKLKGNPYWSIHVNKYRVIYELKGNEIIIADLLQRKYDYQDIK